MNIFGLSFNKFIEWRCFTMGNSPDYLMTAWDWAVNGAGGVPGIPGMVLEQVVNNAVGPAIGAFIVYTILSGGKDKALNISRTLYTPSGVPHPTDGKEYFDQRIKTLDNDFHFQEAFRGHNGKKLARILERATKMTDGENPIAFEHIKKILSEKDFQKLHPVIVSKWRGYHSALLNNDDVLSHSLGERGYPEERVSLVVPAFEKSPTGGSRKVLEIPAQYMQPNGMPDMDHVRVFIGRNNAGSAVFEHDPNHEASERLRTLEKIRDKISDNRAEWFTNYGIDIETGNILTMPKLEMRLA